MIGLALLIRFSVLWLVEWINIKLSTEVIRSLSSISWQTPSLVPAYHSHSWDLPSLNQYFAQSPPTLGSSCSRYPYPTFTEFFLCYAHGFIRLCEACWKKQSFHDWFPSDKRSQAYRWNTPNFFLFFEKDTSSDLWEVATCLSKLLWMMDDSIPIFPFCTSLLKLRIPTVGRGWQWCIKVYFISISSHSIQDWLVTFFHST